MDLGKIMIGFALVMLAAGLLVSPSGGAECDRSCTRLDAGALFLPQVPR